MKKYIKLDLLDFRRRFGLSKSFSIIDTLNTFSGVTPELRRTISDKLYECLIKTLISLLDKLDVGYNKQDVEHVSIVLRLAWKTLLTFV